MKKTKQKKREREQKKLIKQQNEDFVNNIYLGEYVLTREETEIIFNCMLEEHPLKEQIENYKPKWVCNIITKNLRARYLSKDIYQFLTLELPMMEDPNIYDIEVIKHLIRILLKNKYSYANTAMK